jgi:hypothetical protein
MIRPGLSQQQVETCPRAISLTLREVFDNAIDNAIRSWNLGRLAGGWKSLYRRKGRAVRVRIEGENAVG